MRERESWHTHDGVDGEGGVDGNGRVQTGRRSGQHTAEDGGMMLTCAPVSTRKFVA